MTNVTLKLVYSVIPSGENLGHKSVEIFQKIIQKDLQVLESSIYPKYQEAFSNIPVQKAKVRKHSQK